MKKWLVLLAVGAAFSAEAKRELVTEYIQRYNLPRSITNAVVEASGYGEGIVFTLVRDKTNTKMVNYVVTLPDDNGDATFLAFDKYFFPLKNEGGKDVWITPPTTFERKSYGRGERFVYPYAAADQSSYRFCTSTDIDNESGDGKWDTTKPTGVTNPFVQTYHSDWQYTITYNPNGASEKAYTSEIINSGTLAANEFTRSGYTFKGWAKTKSGAVTYEDEEEITPKDDLTLYAVWEAKKYTATFDANGGNLTGDSSRQVTFGEAMGSMPGVYKNRYVLSGWYVEDSQGTDKIDAGWVVDRAYDFTIKAKWGSASYKLSFKKNLEGETENIPSTTIWSDETYEGKLPTVTNACYNFTGWYTLASGGDKIDETSKVEVESDQTLYAHWTGKQFTLNFDPNGGTCSPSSKEVTNGEKYGDLPLPELKDRVFRYWELNGVQISGDDVVKIPSNSWAVAKWQNAQVKVVLDACGGIPPATTNIYTVDEAYGNLPTVTKAGYAFAGWYTTNDYAVAEQVLASTLVKSSVKTLYARWKSAEETGKVTITYDANGGSETVTKEYTRGAALGKLPTVTRDGYYFFGWFTDESNPEKITEDSIAETTMTVKAYWSLKRIHDVLSPNDYNICINDTEWVEDAEEQYCNTNSVRSEVVTGSTSAESSISAFVYGVGALKYASRIVMDGGWGAFNVTIGSDNVEHIYDSNKNWGMVEKTVSGKDLHKCSWIINGDPDSANTAWISNVRWTPTAPGSSIDNWTSKINLEQPPTNAVFTTGGSVDWLVTSDPDIIVATNVLDSRSTWVRMEVEGKGVLAFDWKASCERGYTDESGAYRLCDRLEFVDGDETQFVAEGLMADYTNLTYACKSTGKHTFIWRYVKDLDGLAGADAGWLKNVTWTEYVEPPVPHTVTFDVGNHGQRTGGGALTQTVEYQASPIAPTISVNAGYEFCGWVDDATGKTNATEEVEAMAITDDTDFTAAYAVTKYAIAYENTMDQPNDNPTGYTVEDAITFTALTDPEGYTFKGWSPAKIAKGSTGDLTVTAIFLKDSTIAFDANGGSGGPEEVVIACGKDMPEISEKPTRTKYAFLGYFDAKSGGTQYYDAELDGVRTWDKTDAAVTLYAHWTRKSSLTIVKTGSVTSGCSVQPDVTKSYTIGNTVQLTASGTSTRMLAGWYADAGCTQLLSYDSNYSYVVPEKTAVSVYAKFAKKTTLLPKIVCADSVSFTPGSKFRLEVVVSSLYTGEIVVSASGLPSGLKYENGAITGTPKACSSTLTATIVARNEAGKTTKEIVFTPVNPGFTVKATVLAPDGSESDPVAYGGKVTPYVGVNFEMKLAATPNKTGRDTYAPNSVTVSGLGNGLKYDEDAGEIVGVPTSTSKQKVVLKYSNKWGWTTTFKFYIVPKVLPTWLTGGYNGSTRYGSAYGPVQLTVGTTGKLSGKITTNGKSRSFSVNHFECCTNASENAEVFVAIAKVGNFPTTFSFTAANYGEENILVGYVTAIDELGKVDIEGYQNLWAREDVDVPAYKNGKVTVSSAKLAALGIETEDGDGLVLRFKANGVVTAVGAVSGIEVPSLSSTVVVTGTLDDKVIGEIVIPYGRYAVILPVKWAEGVKPSLRLE